MWKATTTTDESVRPDGGGGGRPPPRSLLVHANTKNALQGSVGTTEAHKEGRKEMPE